MTKKPCVNCVYFKECGNTNRTVPCNGRKTKSEVKRESRKVRFTNESRN